MAKRAATFKKSSRTRHSRGIRQRRLSDALVIGGTVLFSLAITVVFISTRPPDVDRSLPDKSVPVASLGVQHIAPGSAHPAYNSNPPTSGSHYGDKDAGWGVFLTAIPDEVVVHNLEHGGVWISYRDAADAEAVLQLQDIVKRYPSNVIMTHRPANDSRIAVVAWQRLLKLDTVDTGQIYNFISRYQYKGPENVR